MKTFRKLISLKLIFIAGALMIHSLSGLTQNKLFLVDPLEPLFPDSNQLSGYSGKYMLDFPEGTVADVHVVIQAPIGELLTISAVYGGKTLPLSCWSQLVDVPVEQNTGLDSRTEQYTNQKNPFVIRRAPFHIYEAIEPLLSNEITTTKPFTAFRLAVPSGLLSKMGKHRISLSVKTKKWEGKGEFVAQVFHAKLPGLAQSRFFYTNWFRMSEIEQRHKVERWSDDWYRVLDKYVALMAAGRQNAIIVPGELIHLRQGKIVLDEEKMLRYINLFRQYGFQYFESPHLMDRGKNDDWGDPEIKVALTGRGYNSSEAKQDIDTIIGLIKAFTQKNNLTHAWLQHISDEPTRTQAACYKEVVGQVKSIYPEIKIMDATNDRDGLAGAIDIWCPLINDFQENEDFFRKRVALNEKVLVYTCLIPGGQWLNRLLDQERLRQVYFGWGAAHYNTSGFLHWGLNQYMADPWQQSVVHHPAPGAGATNFLPAGDTHIFYPGANGPLSSTRFEAHRIGIEDYELLTDLKQKNATLADLLINKVFRSYTDYNLDIQAYRAARRDLLKALSQKE